MEDAERAVAFVQEGCRGKWLQSHCEVRPSALGGLGVFARQDVEPGTMLLQLHKNAVFSASTCSIANLLVDAQVDGMLALSLAFVYETTVFRERSHWTPYLQSISVDATEGTQGLALPPSYWAPRERALLEGTALDTLYDALAPQAEIQDGFELALALALQWQEEAEVPVPEFYLKVDVDDGQDVELKLARFVSAAYTVASRCVEVDAFHESALVPLADLFNHGAAAEGDPLAPTVQFQTVFDVCDQCGEPGVCGHAGPDSPGTPEDSDEEDEETPTNVIDMALVAALEGEEAGSSPGEHPEDSAQDPDECVQIVATQFVPLGQELLISYGEMSNVLLLARYGFCVQDNPHDLVDLAQQALELGQESTVNEERMQWWAQTGHKMYGAWHKLMRQEDAASEEDPSDEEHGEEHDHDHCSDGCGDHSHPNNEHEEWLSEMTVSRIDASESLRAFARLLALPGSEFRKLHKHTVAELPGEFEPEAVAVLHSSSPLSAMVDAPARALLQQLGASKQPLPLATELAGQGGVLGHAATLIANENSILAHAASLF